MARKKKNTAPGHSGLRIDLVAGACERVRRMVWKLISIPYLTGYMYDCWADEIVNWVYKEKGNMDTNRRRPLMYYEVLRKTCMGVKKGKVMAIWRKTGRVDEDNYAFMQHLSTAEPIMIKKMIAEDARRYGKMLKIVDVDFSKAYDTTEKYAKDISLMFMGMSRRGRRMWQWYDSRRRMRVLTAYGYTGTCVIRCGAWGQGAEESPYGWTALMSWMGAHVNRKMTAGYRCEG